MGNPKAKSAKRMASPHMPSIIDALVSHAFWVHFCLIGGDILATAAVGWGIIWEAPEQSARRHRIAKQLVIWGIVAESLCSVGLFAFDEGISQRQADFIRSQNNELIELESENLLLYKASLPRRVGIGDIVVNGKRDERGNALYREMKKFPGTRVLIQSVPDFEAQTLAGDIFAVAKQAGWTPEIISEKDSHIPSGYLNAPFFDVEVITLEESPVSDVPPGLLKSPLPKFSALSVGARAFAEYLARNLSNTGTLGAIWRPEYTGRMREFRYFDFPPRTILVVVGPKPQLPPIELLRNVAAAKAAR